MRTKPSQGPDYTADEAAAGLAAYLERHRSMEPDGLALIRIDRDKVTGEVTYVRGAPPPSPAAYGGFFDVTLYSSHCAHEPVCSR